MSPIDPEIQPTLPDASPPEPGTEISPLPEPVSIAPDPWETRAVRWVFLGSQGLRAGWSALAFILLFAAFAVGIGTNILNLIMVSVLVRRNRRRAVYA